MADKLKPCPFCGNKAEITKLDFAKSYFITCSSCFAEMGQFKAEEEAIHMWNTRPNPWHTGTPPMEKGTYLIRQDCLYAPHIVCERKRDGESLFIEGSNQIIEDGILAYQKIEPYKEKDNG